MWETAAVLDLYAEWNTSCMWSGNLTSLVVWSETLASHFGITDPISGGRRPADNNMHENVLWHLMYIFLAWHRFPWWRHKMDTFSALLVICAGNSPAPGEFPVQRPVTRSFDVFFDLCLNKRLSKQSWGWWFETLSCPLWRHRNVPNLWTPHNLCHLD